MWSARTLYRRRKKLNVNSYVFDNTFQCQAANTTTSEAPGLNKFYLRNLLNVVF